MKTETIATVGTASYPAAFAVRFSEMPNVPTTPQCDLDQDSQHFAAVRASRPRPWIRYWARSVDLVIVGAAFAIVAGSLGVNVEHWNNFAFGWLVLLLWIPFEAAFVSSCGTTPGKWLFNIRLSRPDQSFLTLQQALGRSVAVLIRGLGFGIPIVSFFTQIAACGTLNKRGATSWDEQYGVVVRHDAIGAGRILGIILTFFVLLLLIGLGNAMNDPTASAAGLKVVSY
jgi:uncharacterized RDD family membrane protein YckC